MPILLIDEKAAIVEKGTESPADLLGLDRIEYKSYAHLTEELKKKVVPIELDRFRKIRGGPTLVSFSLSIGRATSVFRRKGVPHTLSQPTFSVNIHGQFWIASIFFLQHS